jgi:hypothetical protein
MAAGLEVADIFRRHGKDIVNPMTLISGGSNAG